MTLPSAVTRLEKGDSVYYVIGTAHVSASSVIDVEEVIEKIRPETVVVDTSLNPTIAAGWVSGLVEALLRKPKVEDCEALGEDTTTLKGWYRNRITRVLLVVVLSNFGSMLGTWIGALGVFKAIGGEG